MSKAVVIGNGESRKWFGDKQYEVDAVTWGCNAIWRDVMVDNLVAVDYGMQQEIYESNNWRDIQCWFANWSVLPSDAAEMMLMGYNIPEEFIHKTTGITDRCVISGKDPLLLQDKIASAIEMNSQLGNFNLDMKDLQMKLEKDVGLWITYVYEDDNINTIDFPVGWSAGNTAMHLACQQGASEIYILGFDLSSYDEPLNNIYKGTDNYLPSDAKGFNSVNWKNQMQTVFREFKDVQFSWVVSRPWDWPDAKEELIQENNLSYLTKTQFCDKVSIL